MKDISEGSRVKIFAVLAMLALVVIFAAIVGAYVFRDQLLGGNKSGNNLLASASSLSSSMSTTNQTTVIKSKVMNKPNLTIDQSKKYTATMRTEKGDIVIELFANKVPITVNNFVYLSESKFYDDVIFHRTIPGFMIQGGDPTGTGMGGPGYRFDDEDFSGEYDRGVIAMANAGPDTNGSQFFIMHADYPLPQNYVIFGKVVSGMDAVDAIAASPTVKDGRENSKPVNPVKILGIDIVSE